MPRHPSQLYQVALEGLLLFVLGRMLSQDQAAFDVVFDFLSSLFPNLGSVRPNVAA